MRVNMGAHWSDEWRLWALPIDDHGGLVVASFENSYLIYILSKI